MKLPILPAIITALALAACADGPARLSNLAQRVELAQVALDAASARQQINAYRAEHGLGPITIDERLTAAAQRQSEDLSAHDTISHRGSDGTNPWDRVRQSGYRAKLVAENVGVGQRSFAEVLQGWKNSSGHKRNLLLPEATQMGIALVVNPASRNQTYWTLVLGTPSTTSVATRRSS